MIPFEELKQRMADRLDPDDFIERFGITTEQLIEAFEYKVEEKIDELMEEFDETEETETNISSS